PMPGATLEELDALAPPIESIPDYVRNEEEQAVVDLIKDRQQATPPVPLWYIRKDAAGKLVARPVHLDPEVGFALSMKALGVVSPMMLNAIVEAIACLCKTDGDVDEVKFQRLLATVCGIGPQDELEAMLAAQMAAVHDLTMTNMG